MGTLKQETEEGGHTRPWATGFISLLSKRCTHFIHNWGNHILIKQALHLPVLLIICPLRHLLCLVTFSHSMFLNTEGTEALKHLRC